MDARFVSLIADATQHIDGALADVGSRQQRAVQQRAYPVMRDDRRSLDLVDEPFPEYAPDRATRVIRTEREQERRTNPMTLEELEQPRDAFSRPPQRVDVDLEANPHALRGSVLPGALIQRVRERRRRAPGRRRRSG